MPLGDSKAEKEKTTEDLETSCSQDRPGPQEPPGGQGSWEEHSICRSLGRASCHPSSRVEGQHSPLDHHKGSAPTPSLSPVYAPPLPATTWHPAVSAILGCTPTPVWQESPMAPGKVCRAGSRLQMQLASQKCSLL